MQLLLEAVDPPLIAVRPEQAARMLSVSRSFFDEHILPCLKVTRIGRLKLIPVAELEAWVQRAKKLPLEKR